MRELAREMFLRAGGDPSASIGWTREEFEFASTFSRLLSEATEDSQELLRFVSRTLYDPKGLTSTNLVTPMILYFIEDWIGMATSWKWPPLLFSGPFNSEGVVLWASLERAIILGGPDFFDGAAPGRCTRFRGQQYYGVRPADLRGVLDEAAAIKIQRFLYMREQCLAWSLPVWAGYIGEMFDARSHEQMSKRAQARLADPSYNPLDFCSFDDDACWEELKLQSG